MTYPNTQVKVPLKDGLLIRRVIQLARLWKSLSALDKISREVFLAAFSGLTSISFTALFIIAVGLEDPTLLGFIVAQTEQRQWVFAWSDMNCFCLNSVASLREERSEVDRQHHYDFGCWPLEHYQSIPPHIIHTLLVLHDVSAKAVNYSRMGRQLRSKLLQTREFIRVYDHIADSVQMDVATTGLTLYYPMASMSTFLIVEGRQRGSNTSMKKVVKVPVRATSTLKRNGGTPKSPQTHSRSKLRSADTIPTTPTW
jgi:hypothetical protein